MIISHKYKFLFIGLPFSASSAISKELHLKYNGEPYLRKHSLYHEFKKAATKEEKEYFVFAVLRNPMQIIVTVYEKMKANAKGNFTNTKLFTENGGHINQKQRNRFNYIQHKNPTFQEYFKKYYRKPYDNLFAITADNCDFVINYDNIAEDYLKALKRAGVENPTPLPLANKTVGKKKDLSCYYTDDIKEKAIAVFGPFLEEHNYNFPKEWGYVKTPLRYILYFKILRFLRVINQKYLKKFVKIKGIKGSIYGDMQRDHLKKSN